MSTPPEDNRRILVLNSAQYNNPEWRQAIRSLWGESVRVVEAKPLPVRGV